MAVAAVGGLLELLFELGQEPHLDGGSGVCSQRIIDVQALHGKIVVWGAATKNENARIDCALREVKFEEPVTCEGVEYSSSIL